MTNPPFLLKQKIIYILKLNNDVYQKLSSNLSISDFEKILLATFQEKEDISVYLSIISFKYPTLYYLLLELYNEFSTYIYNDYILSNSYSLNSIKIFDSRSVMVEFVYVQ